MKFSVCIPNYNYGRYLTRTIESVLSQDHGDLEVLVSDNASTDDSREVVAAIADPRVHLHTNSRNVGFAANVDRAARLATGDVIIVLSSDDLMRPQALSTYARVFAAADPERTLVCSAYDVIDAEDRVTGRQDSDPLLWGPRRDDPALSSAAGVPTSAVKTAEVLARSLRLMRNPFGFLTLAYPRSVYARTEGYWGANLQSPDKRFAWVAMSAADTAVHIGAPLFAYRWHDANQTAAAAGSGALKHLVDQYICVFDTPQEVLDHGGVSRTEMERRFIREDVALRGLRKLAAGQRDLARRGIHLGAAAYPTHLRRDPWVWALRAGLAAAPIGERLARLVEPTALRRRSSRAFTNG